MSNSKDSITRTLLPVRGRSLTRSPFSRENIMSVFACTPKHRSQKDHVTSGWCSSQASTTVCYISVVGCMSSRRSSHMTSLDSVSIGEHARTHTHRRGNWGYPEKNTNGRSCKQMSHQERGETKSEPTTPESLSYPLSHQA